MKILLKLKYNGRDFCGYQVQPGKRTVQGELNRAAKELFGFDCDVTGCSRTDSGVHANVFCATLTKSGCPYITSSVSTDRIPVALNAHLPVDVAVFSAEEVGDGFHPRYSVIYKEYEYRIYNAPVRSPFEEGRSWHIPYVFSSDDVAKMNCAAQHFVGEHDFTAFRASGSSSGQSVRTVKYASVIKEGDVVSFKVAADGFLYNMVRIMTGTLVSVGRGVLDPDSIPDIISSLDRSRAGATAPPDGLYLNKIVY